MMIDPVGKIIPNCAAIQAVEEMLPFPEDDIIFDVEVKTDENVLWHNKKQFFSRTVCYL